MKNNSEASLVEDTPSRYVCGICHYVYDEKREKVRWEALPADWQCPDCGVDKSMFSQIKRRKRSTQ